MDISFSLIFGAAQTALGIVWVIGARNDRLRHQRKLAAMKLVEAEVTRHRKEESYDPNSAISTTTETLVPMVEYVVNNHRYTAAMPKDLPLGAKLTVAYNPAMPSDAMLAEPRGRHAEIAGSVITLGGIAVVLASLGMFP